MMGKIYTHHLCQDVCNLPVVMLAPGTLECTLMWIHAVSIPLPVSLFEH